MNWYKIAQSHEQLIEQLKAVILDVYGKPIHPDALRRYLNMTDEEIKWYIDIIDTEDRKREEFNKRQEANRKIREDKKLQTENDAYEFDVGTVVSRVVCSEKNPKYEIRGMPSYAENVHNDPGLIGYYGIHVGSPDEWLPVMARDGYCNGNAYVYDILVGESSEPFYMMDDYHINVKDEAPNANIIFSKYQIIPANLIKLVEIIPAKKIKPADDLFPGSEP